MGCSALSGKIRRRIANLLAWPVRRLVDGSVQSRSLAVPAISNANETKGQHRGSGRHDKRFASIGAGEELLHQGPPIASCQCPAALAEWDLEAELSWA